MESSKSEANGSPPDRWLCPRCGGSGVVLGAMSAFSSEQAYGAKFFPRNTEKFQNHGVGVSLEFRACLACGHVWSSVDPNILRHHIAMFGGEIARQELDEIARGIYRDLPDTDVAREIAEKVAEIDFMVRNGQFGAVGRYRELGNVTWYEAIKVMNQWARLTRAEKLELFGWVPKKKPPIDEWF